MLALEGTRCQGRAIGSLFLLTIVRSATGCRLAWLGRAITKEERWVRSKQLVPHGGRRKWQENAHRPHLCPRIKPPGFSLGRPTVSRLRISGKPCIRLPGPLPLSSPSCVAGLSLNRATTRVARGTPLNTKTFLARWSSALLPGQWQSIHMAECDVSVLKTSWFWDFFIFNEIEKNREKLE